MKGTISPEALMDAAYRCVRLLDEKKARDTVLMNLKNVNAYFDFFLIATGNSLIHCRALAREVQKFFNGEKIKERNRPNLNSSWIVLDYDDIVVHIFTRETRDFYQLEKLWSDAEMLDASRRSGTGTKEG